jgi:hypothetical protein
MKKVTIFILIVFSSLSLAGCSLLKSQDKKYEECVAACNKNKTCLEFGYNPGQQFADPSCLKYNDAECKNICIEKYK